MSRAHLVIREDADRIKAAHWCSIAPVGTRIQFQRGSRSLSQNRLLWSRLTQLAEQMTWHGVRLSAEDFKDILTASLRKSRVVPGIDPGSFVVVGLHTSGMDKEEMTLLLDLMSAFAAEHGIIFRDEEDGTERVQPEGQGSGL